MKHNYKNDISYFTISKVYYSTTMPNISVRILNENDIIKYKFNTTKDVYTKCAVKYNYDYGQEDFAKTVEYEINDTINGGYGDYDYEYYGEHQDKTQTLPATCVNSIFIIVATSMLL